MSLEFHEEQLALRDAARDFFAKESSPARVRDAWNPAHAEDRERWRQMASLGFLSVTIPETHGGLGLGDTDLVLVLEEAGYAALPEPLLEAAAVVSPIIARHGTAAQQERWLPAIAAGDALATAQLMGAPVAPYGAAADVALVEADGRLHLVAREELVVSPARSVDHGRHTAALAHPTSVETALPDAALADARTRGAAAAAAVLNGVSRRLLDTSVSYAGEREQFGRLIGSFQAVKHLLAEVAVAVEVARPAAWYSAMAIDRGGSDAALAASAAKAAANEAATRASYHALQVHGGIGFTWEHDLHLWMKRGKALEESYGSARHHHRILGDAVLDSDDLVEDFGPALTTS